MINPKSARNLNNLRTNILEFVRAFMTLYISILHTNTLQELDKLYTMKIRHQIWETSAKSKIIKVHWHNVDKSKKQIG